MGSIGISSRDFKLRELNIKSIKYETKILKQINQYEINKKITTKDQLTWDQSKIILKSVK